MNSTKTAKHSLRSQDEIKIAPLVALVTLYLVVSVTAGICVCGFIHMTCWVHTADRQIRVIRRMAFNSILRQHMGYFDKNKSGALVTSLTE